MFFHLKNQENFVLLFCTVVLVRLCIGNNFAMMEMQVLLAMVCPVFDFVLPENFRMECEPLVTLRPKHGLPVRVEKIMQAA